MDAIAWTSPNRGHEVNGGGFHAAELIDRGE
jgi:hypothetical protein